MVKQFVYNFSEGDKSMKFVLGGKGANLCEMTSLGLPIPQGFIVSTEACQAYYESGKEMLPEIEEEVEEKLRQLENLMGKKLGDSNDPLLVSVRSGAAASMPGMMDTILNLGLNDKSVEGLSKSTRNPRFAYDSYRRFIQMFGNVVMGVSHDGFEKILHSVKEKKKVHLDTDLDLIDLKEVIKGYKDLIKRETGEMFPDSAKEQLLMSIEAVFNSWNIPTSGMTLLD